MSKSKKIKKSNGQEREDLIDQIVDKPVARVSKIMLWPSRKLNLGNYNTADLNAGIELVFDKPVEVGSKELEVGFNEARKIIREEFTKQYEPYKKLIKKGE